jgi:hypothetical protein
MALRLYLRAGGKLREWRGDADGIARAFAALPARGAATLAALGGGGDGLYLRRDIEGRFRFSVVALSGPAAMGRRVSARRDFGADDARHLLELYAAGDPAWRTRIAWKRGVLDLPVAILAPATILICVAGYFVVAGATGGLTGWSRRYLPNLIVGLVLIGAVFAYIDWFFRRLRRRMAEGLGRTFGLRIVEAERLGLFTRPGMWESADGGIVSELKVTLLDLAVLLLGLLVPVFAIGTTIVLAALPILA